MAIETDPGCLEELSLAGLRPQVSITALILALRPSDSLAYLDLQKNPLSEAVALELGDFVMHSKSLEYLNLSSCGLRSKASGHVLDGLMKNRSIKYLCLNANSFASDDHLLAAKAGRMLQGHPRLLHVNLADCCLVREELIYLTMCIRDSKNIQGIHLTGNSYSHYDRLLMRALLPGKAKWPHPPATVPKFETISSRDKLILVMLNSSPLGCLPPAYIPEVGMSNV